MPELPEVQCVVNTLEVLKNKIIKEVIILNNRLREPVQENLNTLLKNKIIKSVERKGKYILFELDSGLIVSHLGMTGKFLLQNNLIENKFNRIVIKLTDGTYLIYNDIRKFGFLTYEKELKDNKYINKLGIEPLTKLFNKDFLFKKLSKNKTAIKKFLLDQSIIAGLGNIYVIEVLYNCKISPLKIANTIDIIDSERLVIEIKRILKESIDKGGSSISDYRDANDKEGSFQDSHNIYGKKIDTLGHTIEIIKQNGRSTYYCPICQNI